MARFATHLVDDRGRVPSPWDRLREALTFQYGHERMSAIFDCRDAATNADLRAWRQLGQSMARTP